MQLSRPLFIAHLKWLYYNHIWSVGLIIHQSKLVVLMLFIYGAAASWVCISSRLRRFFNGEPIYFQKKGLQKQNAFQNRVVLMRFTFLKTIAFFCFIIEINGGFKWYDESIISKTSSSYEQVADDFKAEECFKQKV